MKDLDFDELDRAVNSLMSGGGLGSTPSNKDSKTDDQQVVNLDSAKAASGKPSIAAQPQQPQQEARPKPQPRAEDVRPAPTREPASRPRPEAAPRPSSAASRQSGRFMDIVHQSSDMRSSRTLTPPSAKASRHRGDITQPAVTPTPTPKASKVQPGTQSLSGVIQPTTAEELVGSPQHAEDTSPADGMDSQDDFEPYTPFVPDAKVEKRPLGGLSPDLSVTTSSIGEEPSIERDLEANAKNQLSVGNEPLKAEFQSDIVSIESEDFPVVEPDEEATDLSAPAEPKAKIDKPTTRTAEPKPVYSKSISSVDAGTNIQSKIESIPNQYKTEPKVASDDESDIFNTDTFAQPLAHPAKRKSGWLTVVFIVLLIVLGAGLGALVYLYVL